MTKPLWYAAAAVEEPSLPSGWFLAATLRPRSLKAVPQATIQLDNGDWVVSQDFDGANLVLTRFNAAGTRLSEMRVSTGDHGDRLENRNNKVGLYIDGITGTWVELPWVNDKTWSKTEAMRYRSTRTIVPFGARSWFQGEIVKIDIDNVDYTIRLYGVPFKTNGPSKNPAGKSNPNIPANLEYYSPGNSKIVKRELLGHLARDAKGNPIGGRLEPEGLALGSIKNTRVLLAGFAVGTIGDTYMVVYARAV